MGPYSREYPTFPLHSSHGWLGRPLLFCCSRFPPACLAFARTARAPPPPESSAASQIATGGHLPLPLPSPGSTFPRTPPSLRKVRISSTDYCWVALTDCTTMTVIAKNDFLFYYLVYRKEWWLKLLLNLQAWFYQ